MFTVEPQQGALGGVMFVNGAASLSINAALLAAGWTGSTVSSLAEAFMLFYDTGGSLYVVSANPEGATSLVLKNGLFGSDPAQLLSLKPGPNLVFGVTGDVLEIGAVVTPYDDATVVKRQVLANIMGQPAFSTRLSNDVYLFQNAGGVTLQIPGYPGKFAVTKTASNDPLFSHDLSGMLVSAPLTCTALVKASQFEVTRGAVGLLLTPRLDFGTTALLNVRGTNELRVTTASDSVNAVLALRVLTSGDTVFAKSVTAPSLTTTDRVTCAAFTCGALSFSRTTTASVFESDQRGFLFITNANSSLPKQVLSLTAAGTSTLQIGSLRNSDGADVMTVAAGATAASFVGDVIGNVQSRGLLRVVPVSGRRSDIAVEATSTQGSALTYQSGAVDRWCWECLSPAQPDLVLWRVSGSQNNVYEAAMTISQSTRLVSVEALSVKSLSVNGKALAAADELAGYLPLAGGTLTGQLNGTAAVFSGQCQTGILTVAGSLLTVAGSQGSGGNVACHITNDATNSFASLYLNSGPVGSRESAQLFLGQGGGMVLRTVSNLPISLSVNNTQQLRLTQNLAAFTGAVTATDFSVTGNAPGPVGATFTNEASNGVAHLRLQAGAMGARRIGQLSMGVNELQLRTLTDTPLYLGVNGTTQFALSGTSAQFNVPVSVPALSVEGAAVFRGAVPTTLTAPGVQLGLDPFGCAAVVLAA
jgi:hypothetical protein